MMRPIQTLGSVAAAILLLVPAARASECPGTFIGVLESHSGPFSVCYLLRPHGLPPVAIGQIGSYAVGDTVMVVGSVLTGCTPCQDSRSCFVDYEIGGVRPYDFGCGRFVRDPDDGCHYIETECGRVAAGGLAGYSTGDSLEVVGLPYREPVATVCDHGGYPLEWISVIGCALVPALERSWGQIKSQYR